MEAFGALIILAICLAIYFFPTAVAGSRGHRNTLAIFILNLLLGWLILGWIGALVWACTANVKPSAREELKNAAKRWNERQELIRAIQGAAK
jgi:hypothetical protein